jgi:hypothetical protein
MESGAFFVTHVDQERTKRSVNGRRAPSEEARSGAGKGTESDASIVVPSETVALFCMIATQSALPPFEQ